MRAMRRWVNTVSLMMVCFAPWGRTDAFNRSTTYSLQVVLMARWITVSAFPLPLELHRNLNMAIKNWPLKRLNFKRPLKHHKKVFTLPWCGNTIHVTGHDRRGHMTSSLEGKTERYEYENTLCLQVIKEKSMLTTILDSKPHRNTDGWPNVEPQLVTDWGTCGDEVQETIWTWDTS